MSTWTSRCHKETEHSLILGAQLFKRRETLSPDANRAIVVVDWIDHRLAEFGSHIRVVPGAIVSGLEAA
jgi:hypothetical protein